MAGDASEGTRQLDQTPTWAVASVCAIIIIISIGLEKLLHKLGKVFMLYFHDFWLLFHKVFSGFFLLG